MLRRLLSGYTSVEGRYDELLSAPGSPRPHWDAFLRSLAGREGSEAVPSTPLTLPTNREVEMSAVAVTSKPIYSVP